MQKLDEHKVRQGFADFSVSFQLDLKFSVRVYTNPLFSLDMHAVVLTVWIRMIRHTN